VRHFSGERLLLVLIALTALAFAYGVGWPDVSRLALTQSIALDGTLTIDRYQAETGDKSFYGGHWYSDKAPGVSLLAVPTFEAMRATGLAEEDDEQNGIWRSRGLLQAARLLTGGLAYLVCVLLVGRATEGFRPGTGLVSAATFGLATMAMPLAATTLGHLAAGALAFSAFLLARRGHAAPAGASAAAAVLFDYPAALAAVIVAAYALWRFRSVRFLGRLVLGAVLPLLALAAYDTAAFGSPTHVSYRYVAGSFAEQQHEGVYGIRLPRLGALWEVLAGDRGLITFSPVLLLAAAGLVLLWRRGFRGEAAACAAVTAGLVLLSAAYWDPFGGLAPGPRFVAPALPFLALGLPEVYARRPRLTGAVALVSVGGMLYQAGTWAPNYDFSTVWWWLGLPRPIGFLLVLVPCLAAIALAAQSGRRAKAIRVSQPEG
jgi:hypothetical protein